MTFQANGDGTATISGTPAVGTSNGSGSTVPFGGRLEARNLAGMAAQDVIVTVQPPPVTALGPAKVWIGLKNSDDVGLRVDLEAEVFLKVGTQETRIGHGRLDNQSTGSSGFTKAALYTIPPRDHGRAGARARRGSSSNSNCRRAGPAPAVATPAAPYCSGTTAAPSTAGIRGMPAAASA